MKLQAFSKGCLKTAFAAGVCFPLLTAAAAVLMSGVGAVTISTAEVTDRISNGPSIYDGCGARTNAECWKKDIAEEFAGAVKAETPLVAAFAALGLIVAIPALALGTGTGGISLLKKGP